MKKILIAVGLLGVVLVVWAQNAPNYQNRVPTAVETRRVAGLSEHIQNGARFNFTEYFPGPEQQIAINETNGVVVFTSVGALTNVVVLFPNPTNSQRRAYRLIANGSVTMTLSNIYGTTFRTPTNTLAAFFITATNRAAWVYNNRGTNWFIDPDLP